MTDTENIKTRLSEIEGRRAKATAGPFISVDIGTQNEAGWQVSRQETLEYVGTFEREDDSDFFVTAVTDIGYLSEVCRGLLEERGRFQALHSNDTEALQRENERLRTIEKYARNYEKSFSRLLQLGQVGNLGDCYLLLENELERLKQENERLHALGPELVMLCNDMRDEILRLRKEKVEVLEKAIGAVQSISAGSPETLREVIRVLRTQQEET